MATSPIPAFLGYAEGGGVIGVNQADSTGIGEVAIAPGEDGGYGFGGVAFAVHCGRKNPAGFAKILAGRDEFAVEKGDTNFTGRGGGGIFFEDSKADNEGPPVARVAGVCAPGSCFAQGAASSKTGSRRE